MRIFVSFALLERANFEVGFLFVWKKSSGYRRGFVCRVSLWCSVIVDFLGFMSFEVLRFCMSNLNLFVTLFISVFVGVLNFCDQKRWRVLFFLRMQNMKVFWSENSVSWLQKSGSKLYFKKHRKISRQINIFPTRLKHFKIPWFKHRKEWSNSATFSWQFPPSTSARLTVRLLASPKRVQMCEFLRILKISFFTIEKFW